MKEFFMHLLLYALFAILAIPFLKLVLNIGGWYKNYIIMRLQSRLGWWLLDDSGNILDYIQKKCIDLDIEENYLITSEAEKAIALDIIEKCQAKNKHAYFNCSDSASLKLTTSSYSDFFMSYLEAFLDDKDGRYFDENEMYVEISRVKFESGSYDAKCTATEFGIVYNKIHYMTLLYCEKNSKLNKNNIYHSDSVKKVLDTHEITFWHHQW